LTFWTQCLDLKLMVVAWESGEKLAKKQAHQ